MDELLASDYVSHAPGDPRLSRGGEDIKRIVRTYRSAFPDPAYAVEKRVAEGDMVVTRWTASGTYQGEFMGIPPSGNSIEVSGMSMDRFSGGKALIDDIDVRPAVPSRRLDRCVLPRQAADPFNIDSTTRNKK